MNREDFLTFHWESYPFVSSEVDVVCGRVTRLNQNKFTLLNQLQSVEVSRDKVEKIKHSTLGASIPFDLLKEGDVVAWMEESFGLYLLAPNLSQGGWLKDDKKSLWQGFLKRAHSFFEKREIILVNTPFLVESPGVDHHIDYLEVKGSHTGRKWYLPTSPEIHLKKALCQGWEQIYEIKSCFRDDLPSPHHEVEFTMLEWYRSYLSLNQLSTEVCDFMDEMIGAPQVREFISVSEAFVNFIGKKLTPQTSKEELLLWCKDLVIEVDQNDDWNDLFFRIYIDKIEPLLGQGKITILNSFPPSQASLARINEEGWAERFEVYWKGVELGNAYCELNDPVENRKRFQRENDKRKHKEVKVSPLDEDFFSHLQEGMPPGSGVAFGLSRFFKVLQAL